RRIVTTHRINNEAVLRVLRAGTHVIRQIAAGSIVEFCGEAYGTLTARILRLENRDHRRELHIRGTIPVHQFEQRASHVDLLADCEAHRPRFVELEFGSDIGPMGTHQQYQPVHRSASLRFSRIVA
ncbi:MAG: hypothetical protein VB131_07615, partial [Burkholderia gladioli]